MFCLKGIHGILRNWKIVSEQQTNKTLATCGLFRRKNINEKFDKSNRFDVSSHAAMNYSAQYSLYVNMFFKKVSHAIGPWWVIRCVSVN